jgi:hypothetical protein
MHVLVEIVPCMPLNLHGDRITDEWKIDQMKCRKRFSGQNIKINQTRLIFPNKGRRASAFHAPRLNIYLSNL